MQKIKLGLTLGDPTGIGPELVARVLADPSFQIDADVVSLSVVARDERLQRKALRCSVRRVICHLRNVMFSSSQLAAKQIGSLLGNGTTEQRLPAPR